MPRKRGRKKAGEDYLLLYHLLRAGIIPRSDLSLYRGNRDDRYVQRLISNHIRAGRIGTHRYKKCVYCYLTEEGVRYLREKEKTEENRSDLLEEYRDFINAKNQKEAYAQNGKLTITNQNENRIDGDKTGGPESAEWAPLGAGNREILESQNPLRNGSGEPLRSDGGAFPQNASPVVGTLAPRNARPGTPFPTILKSEAGSVGTREARSGQEPSETGPVLKHQNGNLLEGQEAWEPGEREPVRGLNPQKRMKIERWEQGTRGEEFRSEVRRSSAENLLHSAGVLVYPEDKPEYPSFLSALSQPSYFGSFLWQSISNHGMYFPRKQMPGYDNRMLGVLFVKSGWYVVYNTLERFSVWMAKGESDNIKKLTDELRGTIPYRGQSPRSLVFAVGRGMVAAMVTGYKYGHNRSVDTPDFITKNRQYRWMTVEKMRQIYETVYLVEMNGGGVSSLAWLIGTDPESEVGEQRLLVKGNPGAFSFANTAGGETVILDKRTGREVALSQIYDLTGLKQRRDGPSQVTYVGPPWMAEATAKSLGRKLGSYISLYGEGEIPVGKYDEYGELVQPSKPP